MTLSGTRLARRSVPWVRLAVIFNATPAEQTCGDPVWEGKDWVLHPVLADSADPAVRKACFALADGTFNIPAYTTAVFVG